MTTRVLAAAAAVLLTASVRAEGTAAQPETPPPDRGAEATAKESSPAARPDRKHAQRQQKSSETRKTEAKVRGAEQEKAKPCEEVKPCAIE